MGFSEAMDIVFLVGSIVMVVGFLVMLMLPHVELRKGSSYDDRAKTDADATAAGPQDAPWSPRTDGLVDRREHAAPASAGAACTLLST